MPDALAGFPPRLQALDAFRGLTVAGMLLVNNPGTWSAVYPPLRHAEWHGWTPTDLVFPFFLFIVGITTELSFEARRRRGATLPDLHSQLLRRAGIIVLLGLALAAFPFVPLSRLATLRIPGVLQRIGVCYLLAGAAVLHLRPRAQWALVGLLLLGYWALLALVPVPGVGPATLAPPEATLAAWLDRLLLDGHLWSATRTWDPEGPLSTLPAVGTVLLGAAAGRWLRQPVQLARRIGGLAAAGGVAVVLGLVWDRWFPINKNLWTSSYVVFSAGAAGLLLAACVWLTDVAGRTAWTRPFLPFGLNPLVAFVGSGLLTRTVTSLVQVPWHGTTVPLQRALHEAAFASWLPPEAASLAYALGYVALWGMILEWLRRRGIVVRA